MKSKRNMEEKSKKKVADFSRSAGGFRTGAWRYREADVVVPEGNKAPV